MAATSRLEGFLVDWVAFQPEVEPRLPAECLDDEQVAAELEQLQRNRGRDAAREAELILRLAQLRPDAEDPALGTAGARSRSWRMDPEFPGVSQFFPDELAQVLNVGRGTAAFRARRAYAWRDNLPATFLAMRRGQIDERRAGVLAEVLQSTSTELAQQVEGFLLPEATNVSAARLKAWALERFAELDATASDRRAAGGGRARGRVPAARPGRPGDPRRRRGRRRGRRGLRGARRAGEDGQGRR